MVQAREDVRGLNCYDVSKRGEDIGDYFRYNGFLSESGDCSGNGKI